MTSAGEVAGRDPDALALRVLAKAQEAAWGSGRSRTGLARVSVTEDGTAAWDAPRVWRGRAEEDPELDRGPGLAPGRDRPGPTRFDPRTGKRELERAIAQRGWAGKLAMAHVAAFWPRIVGEHIAEHSVVSAFEEGRVDLRASSSAWAAQLRLLEPQIRGAVARELERVSPGGRAPAFEIRIYGPSGPTWRHGRFGAARGGAGPRDTYG